MRLLVLTFVIFCFGPVGGQERYSVIIQEIMADPSPAVGLPSPEWLEIRNRGSAPVNLQGWRIHDSNGSSGVFPSRILGPDSLLIICGTSGLAALSVFGSTMAVPSFPSLDNEGEMLSLTDAAGQTIHAVSYSATWHSNALKKEGGWTLEMIDPDYSCIMQGNWTSSTDQRGGTPGLTNSVNGPLRPMPMPVARSVYTIDSSRLRVVFSESLDSLQAASIAGYNVSIPGVPGGNPGTPPVVPGIVHAFPLSPTFSEIGLDLTVPLQRGALYSLHIRGLRSCDGRQLPDTILRFGLPSVPLPGQLLINELLFNPLPSGYDYVEILQAGNSVTDLSLCWLGNRNSGGGIDNLVRLSPKPQLLLPGEYYVVTADPNRLALHYFSPPQARIQTISPMPSFPDDKGTVVLVDAQGRLIDELPYSEKWHFPLVRDREGVALERIDSLAPTPQSNNWRSAASTVGYGTPGYRNSQQGPEREVQGQVSVRPPVFSPDNDGRDDQCFIFYELPDAGYVADISIYNLEGRLVRHLRQGNLLAASGFWTWDGLDEKGRANPPGPYIILTSVFNLDGRTGKWKSLVVLAR